MQKPVRYYIQTSGQQPVVRSVPVDRPAESMSERAEPADVQARPARSRALGGVRRIRAAIKRGGI